MVKRAFKRTRNKRNAKNKIMPFWWAELFVLLVITVFFGMLFYMERSQIHLTEKNNWSALQIGMSTEKYYDQEEMTEKMLREYLYDIMKYIPRYFKSGETKQGTSRVGFAAAFYDDEHNVIVQSGQRNIILYYDCFNEETQRYEVLWLNMEDYFSDSAIDMFVEHCQNSGGRVSISYIEGYYTESDEFILTGMGYTLEKEGEETLFFENTVAIDSELDKKIIRRNNSDRDTNIWIQLYNEKSSQNEKAWELLYEQAEIEKEKDYTVTSLYGHSFGGGVAGSSDYNSIILKVDGGGVYGIVVYYVPLARLVFSSPTFWLRFVGVSALIQIGMLIIYVLYREIMEKQRKLEHMRNTFINAMAHEMKTPAAVIKNGSECIREGVHPEKTEHYLDMIFNEADHLNDLLNKMLIYTRTSEDEYRLYKESFELKTLVNQVLASHCLAIEFKGVQVDVIEKEAEKVVADQALIKMVIDNYISNGIKYGNENGRMLITLEEKGILVRNQGRNLTHEEQERVWDPLFVIDESRTESGKGSAGMGLAICKNILELHDAEYGVRNEVDGVSFYFTLRN